MNVLSCNPRKPLAHLLLDRNATVTVCHSRTRDQGCRSRRGWGRSN
ncbi:hypothetical protein KLK06_28785 [Nonomuraea sp. NEAU-A123]|nr:hypothetical protein [Nonomuraea sp. NEAU-A123]